MAKNKQDYFSNSLPWVQSSDATETSMDQEAKEAVTRPESGKQGKVSVSKRKPLDAKKRVDVKSAEDKKVYTPERINPNTSESIDVNTSNIIKRQKVTYYINPAFAKKFKILAIEQDMEMSELADEAVSDLLRKYGRI